MSWLAGIAGKAEELLNKVDQAAATSLNTSDGTSSPSGGKVTTTINPSSFSNHSKSNSSGGQLTGITGSISSSASVPSNLNKMNSPHDYLSQMSTSTLSSSKSRNKSVSSSKTVTNKKVKDDELFEFLNSSESTSDLKKNGNGRPKTLLGNKQHSRQSSGSSAGSRGRKTPDGGSVEDNTSSPGTPSE